MILSRQGITDDHFTASMAATYDGAINIEVRYSDAAGLGRPSGTATVHIKGKGRFAILQPAIGGPLSVGDVAVTWLAPASGYYVQLSAAPANGGAAFYDQRQGGNSGTITIPGNLAGGRDRHHCDLSQAATLLTSDLVSGSASVTEQVQALGGGAKTCSQLVQCVSKCADETCIRVCLLNEPALLPNGQPNPSYELAQCLSTQVSCIAGQ